MNEETRKRIDEDWKTQVEKEKKEAADSKKTYFEPSFKLFISSISMQTMIAMGKLENPVTQKLEKNMEQARYLIDTLAILQEKTKGNLTEEEDSLLKDSLFNLRMMYVEETKPKS